MPLWLALVLAAAATGVKYKQAKDVEKNQLGILADAEARSKQKRTAALAAIQEGAEQYKPETRKQALEEEQGQQESVLSGALAQAAGDRAIGAISENTGGKVSGAYTLGKASEEARQTREAMNLARMLSKVGGHGRQRNREALGTMDATSRAATDWAGSRNILESGQRGASMIHPNEATSLIASLIQSYALGSVVGGVGGAAGAKAGGATGAAAGGFGSAPKYGYYTGARASY